MEIMNSDSPGIKHQNIDGQDLIFPDRETWQTLRSEPFIDGKLLGVSFLLWTALKDVQRYEELHLGLGLLSEKDPEWKFYTFLLIDSNFQRVHLECLTCEECGWKGLTANPMDICIYLGLGVTVKDYDLMRRAAQKYPKLPCPQCGATLPRYPIWIEPLN